MSKRKKKTFKNCNPLNPSTEHTDVKLRDNWIIENGQERHTDGKAIYFVCPNRVQMGKALFPDVVNPTVRMVDVDRHAAERIMIDGTRCGAFVDLQRLNQSDKTRTIYTFHDGTDEVQWFLRNADALATGLAILQRKHAWEKEETRWVEEDVPVMIADALSKGNMVAYHAWISAQEDHRLHGSISTNTWQLLKEVYS